jgi:hypothetical protein
MPIALAPDGVRDARTEITRLARQAGRDGSTITISVMIGAPPGMEAPSLDMIPSRDVVRAYADAGADRVVVSLPTLAAADAMKHLDRVAASLP